MSGPGVLGIAFRPLLDVMAEMSGLDSPHCWANTALGGTGGPASARGHPTRCQLLRSQMTSSFVSRCEGCVHEPSSVAPSARCPERQVSAEGAAAAARHPDSVCARRSAEGWPGRKDVGFSVIKECRGLRRGRRAVALMSWHLSLQPDTSNAEPLVGDAAQSASTGVVTRNERPVTAAILNG